ncbi:M50 family metallopeptidase [Paenibacillus sp. y28]|uniref:M50 family metallopeptidase n=1 Tax=Paenibacillus sp. y28 TaxID=3129110 RepID=UPI00301A2172
MGKWLLTILFLFASSVLTRWLPFSSFFRNVDTLIHEFGHAVVTLLFSGEVQYIELFADHSGVTMSMIRRGWAQLGVGLAGYTTAALFTVLWFYLYAKGRQRQGLMLLLVISVVSLALFVRNGFGMLWLGGFIGLTLLVLIIPWRPVTNVFYLFIAFLSLEESVFGPVTLVMASLQRPGSAGDASMLAEATGVPPLIWSGVFAVFSLWCATKSLSYFFRRKPARRTGAEGMNAAPSGYSTRLHE